MNRYFKATREDGYAFNCDKTLYEVGKRVRPKLSTRREICGPGYLHAADVPTETLVGGSWPCRLFEVTGTPEVGFNDDHPHKGGFRQLTVVRELPAHRVFGPQGEELVAMLKRIEACTDREIGDLVAAWGAVRDAVRAAAWVAVWEAAWVAVRAAAWVAVRDAVWYASRGARAAARDASWGAALAVLTRDLIGSGEYTQEHHDLLYGPWAEVIEGNPSETTRRG